MKPIPQPLNLRNSSCRRLNPKLAFLALTAAAVGVLVINHTPGLNGPAYWKWEWRSIDPWRLYPTMFIAFVPFLIGQYIYKIKRRQKT